MPQATKALTAGQFLLTTLVVKVAIVAVLSTMLVRFPWFRRILLTEKRDWPERLIFAASLAFRSPPASSRASSSTTTQRT